MYALLRQCLEVNGGPLSDEDFAEMMRALEPDYQAVTGPRFHSKYFTGGRAFGLTSLGAVWWSERAFPVPTSFLFYNRDPIRSWTADGYLHCDSCLRGVVGSTLAARWGKAGDRG